ncbi:hypothetical protein D3C80_1689830 [compost metagenome]
MIGFRSAPSVQAAKPFKKSSLASHSALGISLKYSVHTLLLGESQRRRNSPFGFEQPLPLVKLFFNLPFKIRKNEKQAAFSHQQCATFPHLLIERFLQFLKQQLHIQVSVIFSPLLSSIQHKINTDIRFFQPCRSPNG